VNVLTVASFEATLPRKGIALALAAVDAVAFEIAVSVFISLAGAPEDAPRMRAATQIAVGLGFYFHRFDWFRDYPVGEA